jgi:hypothetical protein
MASTTNYSWSTPDDTALVKDGAAAIRSLGSAIDSTVFTNAGAAIAKTIVDAKGDIIAATAADTVSRLAVGTNDQVLIADSTAATGLKWGTPSSGSMTLISTTTLTGATVTLSSISSAYKDLRLVFKDFRHTGGGNNTVHFIVNSTNSIYETMPSHAAMDSNAMTASVADLTRGEVQPAVAGNLVVAQIYEYASTTTYKYVDTKVATSSSAGTFGLTNLRSFIRTTSAISSLTFSLAAGSFNGGTVLLYGVN